MAINITELTELTGKDIDRITDLFLDAFHDYPKLESAFPEGKKRKAALEATIRFYAAYDLRFGKGYALDPAINEAVLIVESEEMHYSFFRHLRAGSYSGKYGKAMKQLTQEDRQKRLQLFEELDAMEKTLDIPHPHLYIDFVGVRTELQGQGRGRRLMNRICGYADERELPLMLFTNTEEDIRFYSSLGFEMIGETHSDKFKFTNCYMVRKT
ncbi:MAG TPA: GNAT family N-acetyltransferase [Bacillota bacterium]|nr:GNAT family N-acetyltransferase [Bacillota bacterium]